MTSLRDVLLRLYLPFGIVLSVVVVYHSLNDYKYIQAEENTVKLQVSRHRRENPIGIHYCKFNQYYDQAEGRCLGVPGGGKVLHVENGQSCGINILKPHCSSPLYYHICKSDKSILAQCANRQIFDSRLQRCAYYDSSKLSPSTISPDDHGYYEHVSVPKCTELGQFPVPDHCFMFYTCDTNGHRLHQSVFKCPRNTGYQADKRVCAVTSDCENDDSVDSAICVPDAPSENVESLNSKEAGEENTGETTEISEKTTSINDSSKKEESNFGTYDNVISTTSESITGNPLLVDNYGDKDSNLYKASLSPTQPTQDISVSDTDETSTLKQTLNPIESARKIQNEKDDLVSPLDVQITPSPTVELDDNVSHSMMTSTPVYNTDRSSNIDRESETVDTIPFSTVSYTSSKLDERAYYVTTERYNDDGTVTLPNSNIETLDSPSTISNIPELSSVNEKSLKKEETRDVTEAVDSYQTSTMSNIPESSPIIDTPSKLDEGTQDTFTEEYRNNDNGTVILPNSNTEAIDSTSTINNIPEFPPVSKTTSKSYEEIQSATTEQYENDDKIMTPPNSNTEIVDQNPTPILSDMSATNNPSDNFDTSTLASVISPQADINDNQYTKELFTTSPSIDSKLTDLDLDAPKDIENVSTKHLSEHTDTSDLASTRSALEHITASMDITTITPMVQGPPAFSDTDLMTQNGKDNTETLPAI